MSSEILPPSSLPQPAEVVAAVDPYENLIDNRLGQTRRHVKWVDVADGAIRLAIGVLAYLLLAVLIDQRLVSGGLGVWGRMLLWLGLWLGGGIYFVRRLLPPLLHRVNPIYAAATIEKSEPTLKNSLINFLLLRSHRQEVALWCTRRSNSGPLPIYRASRSIRRWTARTSFAYFACWRPW